MLVGTTSLQLQWLKKNWSDLSDMSAARHEALSLAGSYFVNGPGAARRAQLIFIAGDRFEVVGETSEREI
jgi:hypothetical protein